MYPATKSNNISSRNIHGVMGRVARCALCVAAVFASCQSWAFRYDVGGIVADSLYYGKKLSLYDVSRPKHDNQYVEIDSCVCSPEGMFRFSGEYDSDNLAVIGATYDIAGGVRTDYIATLVMTEGETMMDMPERAPLTGGHVNNELRSMIVEINQLVKDVQSKNISIEQFKSKVEGLCRETLKNNGDNAAGRYALYCLSNYIDKKEWYDIYKMSSPYLRQYAPSMELANRVELMLITESGQTYIDIKGRDSESNEISLSDFVANGKPTVVDFWASWCRPCLDEIQSTIRPLYEKYGKEGKINIIGVGVNDKSENLCDAIGRVGVAWPQIIDMAVSPAHVYGFDSIPFILVIDSDGKIVARGVRGEALVALIESLLTNGSQTVKR